MNIERFFGDVALITISRNGETSVGSGRLIADGLVLTAWHVVGVPAGKPFADGWRVQLIRERTDGDWPSWEAERIWPSGPGKLDLALLRLLKGQPKPDVQVVFASHPNTAPIAGAAAGGFPVANWDETGNAKEYKPYGALDNASGAQEPFTWNLLDAVRPEDKLKWRGMSGSSVSCEDGEDRLYIFGAVEEVPGGFPNQLRVARLETAFADPTFRQALAEALKREPVLARWPPAARPAPPPGSWPSPLWNVVHLFDRSAQADFVESQIGPGPVELVVTGIGDDKLDLFIRRLEERTLPGRDPAAVPRPGQPARGGVRRMLVSIDWDAALDGPQQRFQAALNKLRRDVAFALRGEPDVAGALWRSLQMPDRPAWVDLRIDAAAFDDADVAPLLEWRRHWHEARKLGVLPECGVVYTVSGIEAAAKLPPALARALAPIGGQGAAPAPDALPRVWLPECRAGMIGDWRDDLGRWEAEPSLLECVENLPAQFTEERFRLRAFEHYLRTGVQLAGP